MEKCLARATIPHMTKNAKDAKDAENVSNPIVQSSSPASYLPLRFNVSVGGFFNGGFSVGYENGTLIVQKGTPYDPSTEHIAPSPEAWQTFLGKLDLLGVWKWQRSYWNHDVLDGTQWAVDIKFGKKRLKCEGSNSYPLEDGSPNNDTSYTKTFAEFEKAVADLCGIELSQDSAEEKNASGSTDH